MKAFVIKTQARINDANHAFGQGKYSDTSNILKIEHLLPFIATKGTKGIITENIQNEPKSLEFYEL